MSIDFSRQEQQQKIFSFFLSSEQTSELCLERDVLLGQELVRHDCAAGLGKVLFWFGRSVRYSLVPNSLTWTVIVLHSTAAL